MYKLIIIAALLFAGLPTLAQNKVFKYCDVTITSRQNFGGQTKYNTVLSIGSHANLFNVKDTTVITQLQKVSEFNNEADILNYMTGIGWQLISVNWIGSCVRIYFKKEFDKSELADQ